MVGDFLSHPLYNLTISFKFLLIKRERRCMDVDKTSKRYNGAGRGASKRECIATELNLKVPITRMNMVKDFEPMPFMLCLIQWNLSKADSRQLLMHQYNDFH